jgi:3-hydroxyacyl-[acyl-carrier-protein] dehydratase
MNREEIKQYLPHREPRLLVDERTLDENHVAHSKYHVTGY